MHTFDKSKKKKEYTPKGETEEYQQKLHNKNRLSARERISLLLDKDSFVETTMVSNNDINSYNDGIICGYGTIYSSPIMVYAYDFSVQGGSLSKSNSKKIIYTMNNALKNQCPIISLIDSSGARILDGIDALSSYAEIFNQNVKLSGKVPQISVVLGTSAGGSAYSSTLQDLVFMVNNTSFLFSTGPDVVTASIGEITTKESLGGSNIHTKISGLVNLSLDTELQLLRSVRHVLHYLPPSSKNLPPFNDNYDNNNTTNNNTFFNTCIPKDSNEPYDMKLIINNIIDPYSFFELSPEYAKNIITGFARIGGYTIGIIANQPDQLAGCITSNASIKGSNFIKLCNSYNIPIITFVDVPGAIVGTESENNGTSRYIAEFLRSYINTTVLKITITLRKSYGGGHIIMAPKQTGTNYHYVWPTAQFAVFSSSCYSHIMLRDDPIDIRRTKEIEYSDTYLTPTIAAQRGYIDGIIEPSSTRDHILRHLVLYYRNANTM